MKPDIDKKQLLRKIFWLVLEACLIIPILVLLIWFGKLIDRFKGHDSKDTKAAYSWIQDTENNSSDTIMIGGIQIEREELQL